MSLGGQEVTGLEVIELWRVGYTGKGSRLIQPDIYQYCVLD